MHIPAISAAGKVSTKDDANIWRKGKDASCRCRYNQVHLFLPRACCHYSFLSHANVQISLPLVKAHSDLEDAVPVLKMQQVWEHSANGMEALSCGRDLAPKDPPSARSGPGWRVRQRLAGDWLGGWQDTWAACGTRVPPEHISKGCEMSRPRGAGMCPPAGQLRWHRKGSWDLLEHKKLCPPTYFW